MWLLLSLIFWAFWRRILGGWLGLPRPLIVVVGALAAAAWFPPEWGWIVGLLTAAFWTPGHDFRSNRALWLRYGPVGIPWMLLERYEGRTWWLEWTEWAELS